MNLVIPIENQHSYTQIPRNRDLGYAINNHCDSPSRVLVVDWKGDCFVCGCEAWLPVSVGKIDQFANLKDIWTHPTAKFLQDDIDKRYFTHCAVDRCGITKASILHTSYNISINIDESCNLQCPSCRRDKIMLDQGPLFERKLQQVNHLVDLLERFDQPCHIIMSGNGDPLASHIMRPLIHRFRPSTNQTIRLFTNGLLMKKQLGDSRLLNSIKEYFISIDAGSEPVYEQVRLGGRWKTLMENFDWLRSTMQTTEATVLLKFVLQRANYHDIENFIQLCVEYGFNGTIMRLEDWGTWPNFNDEDVIGNTQHQDHHLAVTRLKRAYSQYQDRIYFNPSLAEICESKAL